MSTEVSARRALDGRRLFSSSSAKWSRRAPRASEAENRARPSLHAERFIRRITAGVDLVRRSSAQRRMRPVLVVPVDRRADFAAEGIFTQGHERQAAEQYLEREYQSLDDS